MNALTIRNLTKTYANGNEALKGIDLSVEAGDFSGMGREVTGIDGIRGKHMWWAENFEVHGGDVQGPFLHGDDRFGVIFDIDATHKQSGERSQMRELAIYYVSDSKIVREEFFGTG